MKRIKPVNFLSETGVIQPVGFSVISAYDNFNDKVTFQYLIYQSENVTIGGGKVEVTDEAYIAWDRSKDSAYQIVADHLGLEIEVPTPPETQPESNEPEVTNGVAS
jgi:hypothetical protein